MARDPILWMRQEYSDIVETVRSHATMIVKHDRIRGGDDVVPPEQLTANSNLPPLKLNAKLTSSGNTLSLVSIDSGVIHNYDDPANGGQGWVQSTLISQVDLSTAGSITDRKYDVFEYYDSQLATPGSNIEILAWTDENNRAVSLDTVDGARLKSTDYSRRYVGTGRYDGSSLYIASQDNNGISWYGTGNPYDPTGADPFTGILITADGVYGYLAGVVQASLTALGKILAGASAVILDALGITILVGGSYADAKAYKFSDGTNIFAKIQAYADAGARALQIIMPGVTSRNSFFDITIPSVASQISSFSVLVGNGAQISLVRDAAGVEEVTVNGGNTNTDTVIKGVTDNNLLRVDASANNIGVGVSVPSVKLDVLGAGKFSGALTVGGDLTVTNTTPKIVMTDTTGSAKSLMIAVDANAADFRESAAASGSLLYLDLSGNQVGVATATPSSPLHVDGPIATRVPRTITAATDTLGNLDGSLICNRAGIVTLTLPNAAVRIGRWLWIKTITANTVVSASSNVVPQAGGAAGTAILAATAGKWAALQSDGANWIIMMSN